MFIHYLSCHSVLEFDEVTLLTELGHDVFSNGAYLDPSGHKSLNRPSIPNGKYFPEYEEIARKFPKTNLPIELITPFDLIICMHTPEWILENWEKIKHKKVVWRTIGQSLPSTEEMLKKTRSEGLKIIRYSPMEDNLNNFIGSDSLIRFYKDPEEFNGWTGHEKRVINITQSLKGRGNFCHCGHIMRIMEDLPSLVYGSGNDDLGRFNGGELPYDLLKGTLRDNRCFLYAGTFPASYTLSFIEAMMTGIPMVCLGRKLAEEVGEIPQSDKWNFYEPEKIIRNGINGFISNDIQTLKNNIKSLLEDDELAKNMSIEGRKTAIQYFGKEQIKNQWAHFLMELGKN